MLDGTLLVERVLVDWILLAIATNRGSCADRIFQIDLTDPSYDTLWKLCLLIVDVIQRCILIKGETALILRSNCRIQMDAECDQSADLPGKKSKIPLQDAHITGAVPLISHIMQLMRSQRVQWPMLN